MAKLAFGTKSSIRVNNCQICDSHDLTEIVSLGHLPQVNVMQNIGEELKEETFFPCELLQCQKCSLVQISHIVDPELVFPTSYSYTSRTTKILREDFANLAVEAERIVGLKSDDLVVDLGSNDGTLLSNFTKFKILGVEPTDACHYAIEHSIPTIQKFFNMDVAKEIVEKYGRAKLITICNAFAHIENVHSIVEAINYLKSEDGVFISENHYLAGLIKTNQWDTIYHEHLRYYSLTSIKYLLEMHGLEVFDVQMIPTHGGSIRVFSANKGQYSINQSVNKVLGEEKEYLTKNTFKQFKKNIVKSKIELYKVINDVKETITGIGVPSRGITLINYVGLNEDIVSSILETKGSSKIGKYVCGTKISVLEETIKLINSTDNLLFLSWHIADEIMPKLRAKGFRGKFIIPLPSPYVIGV
jgi:hypothetical protein